MEKSNIYINRFGSLAEMGIFRESLISGVSAPNDVVKHCYMTSVMDKAMPFSVSRHFKFTELQNERK
jgi:hypothetical protein